MHREKFIPYRKADLLGVLTADPQLPSSASFEQFARLLSHWFHFDFHARLEQLKDDYAPFDPDADTRRLQEPGPAELVENEARLVAGLRDLLEAANYREIDASDLESALAAESLFKVRLHVDFDDFAEVLFFRRGQSQRREVVRKWFGLRKREIEFTNFDRVAVYVRFKDADYFAERPERKDIRFRAGSIVVKLFQNIPKADLEMLFPNTSVRMKLIDKVLIGVPAAVGGIVILATKLLGTLLLVASLIAFWLGLREESVEFDDQALVALGVGCVTTAAFIFRQVNKFKSRKIRFMKVLADNLYYKNLDNNAGVFHRLVDEAEEEECKEALLGYFHLLVGGPASAEALDQRIEAWFQQRFAHGMDFEVHDAIDKLAGLDLIERAGETWSARPLDVATARLDDRWDRVFAAGPSD